MMRLPGHLLSRSPEGLWETRPIGPETVTVAFVLKPRQDINAYQGPPLTPALFENAFGLLPADRQAIREWLVQNGFRVTAESELIIWTEVRLNQLAQALDLDFRFKWEDGQRLYHSVVDPELPDWMAPHILAVIGLQNVTRMRPKFRNPVDTEQLANNGQGFFPQDLVTAYDFPAQFDGSGQTIGLLEFSNGYNPQDIRTFWQTMGIPVRPVTFISVDGTPNDGGVSSVDMEATLDIEWAGAMAPGASLVVYEASAGTSDQSFGASLLKALDYALHDQVNRPSILSISYGDGESQFPVSEMTAWDTVMAQGTVQGVTTFVASGDQGAYGLHGIGWPAPHVDAPANCPHAVAVGGTHLVLNANDQIAQETGWTNTNNNGASGGGISQVFPVPSYQSGLSLPVKPGNHPGRGVPDVAANADPDTGYAVYFQGAPTVVGGTSAAAPLWAALGARLNQARAVAGRPPVGFLNPWLYQLGPTAAFHDITVGNNSYNCVEGYVCTPGWDAVTGWGSPDAAKIILELQSV
ncbi:MAG: S53 family peptidase [Sulfobacillus sp.]|nr:S53 family peptidase [Sulfobacillus sp.]